MSTTLIPPPVRAPAPSEPKRTPTRGVARRRTILSAVVIATVVAVVAAMLTLIATSGDNGAQPTTTTIAVAAQPGSAVYSEFRGREIAFTNGYPVSPDAATAYTEQRSLERRSINGPGSVGQPGTAVWGLFIRGEIASINGAVGQWSPAWALYRAGERQL